MASYNALQYNFCTSVVIRIVNNSSRKQVTWNGTNLYVIHASHTILTTLRVVQEVHTAVQCVQVFSILQVMGCLCMLIYACCVLMCSVCTGVLHLQESGQQSREMHQDINAVWRVCRCMRFNNPMAKYAILTALWCFMKS